MPSNTQAGLRSRAMKEKRSQSALRKKMAMKLKKQLAASDKRYKDLMKRSKAAGADGKTHRRSHRKGHGHRKRKASTGTKKTAHKRHGHKRHHKRHSTKSKTAKPMAM